MNEPEEVQAEKSLMEAIEKAVEYHVKEYNLTLNQVIGVLENYKIAFHNEQVEGHDY